MQQRGITPSAFGLYFLQLLDKNCLFDYWETLEQTRFLVNKGRCPYMILLFTQNKQNGDKIIGQEQVELVQSRFGTTNFLNKQAFKNNRDLFEIYV